MLRRLTRSAVVLLATVLASPVHAQEGHPLKGSWIGVWEANKDAGDDIIMVLNWDGKFEMPKPVDVKGIVTNVDWRNPHAHVFVNVKTGKETLNWAIELESPTILEMDGWTRDSLRPGDSITVKGPRARDGSRQVWG